MTTQTYRPASLKAVIAYKGLVVIVLACISLLSAFSWRNYEAIAAIAQNYIADGEFSLSRWFLITVMHNKPEGLRMIARLAGVYAIAMGIATVGVWYLKRWADFLMLVLAGSPLPLELAELLQEPSWHRLIILILNLAVVVYLFIHAFSAHGATQATENQPQIDTP